jgi:hypothetical protein
MIGRIAPVSTRPSGVTKRSSMYIDTPEGRVDTGAMRPIMRGGYFDYFTVESENRFEMRSMYIDTTWPITMK